MRSATSIRMADFRPFGTGHITIVSATGTVVAHPDAVEVFCENGKKVAEMTEAEAVRIVRDQEARAQMMAELQDAFGNVVDAAIDGYAGPRGTSKSHWEKSYLTSA